jgi:hypothetical protein
MSGRLDRKRFLTTLGAAGVGFGLTAATGGAPSALAHPRPPEGSVSSSSEPGQPLDERTQLHAAFYTAFTAALAQQLGSMAPAGIAPAEGGESRSSQNQGGSAENQAGASASAGESAPRGAAADGQGRNSRDRGKASVSQSGRAMGQTGAQSGERGASAQMSPSGGARSGGSPTGADAIDAAIREALMALIDTRQTQGGLSYGQAEALKTIVATSLAPLAPEPPGLAWLISAQGGAAHGPAESGEQPSGSERQTGGQTRDHAAGGGGMSGASTAGTRAGNEPAAAASGAKAHNAWRGGWP